MVLPVTLPEAKTHLRILDDSQDEEIQGFVEDAAGWVEGYTGHLLETRMVIEEFERFERLKLRAWPVLPDSAVITIESDGTDPIAVENVQIDGNWRPAQLLRTQAGPWPDLPFGGRVRVEFTAGYGDPDEVPRNFKRAMLVLIGAYDADREGGEVMQAAEQTAIRLCRKWKRWTL